MTTQTNYTTDEWNLLTNAPFLVGGAMAAASASGIVGTIKEGVALATSTRNSVQQHSTNELIQSAAAKSVDARSWAQAAQNLLQGKETERMKSDGLETCRRVSQILARKSTPQEANDYKQWLLQIGEDVAKAANEGGGFLNVGGVQVSDDEKRMLTQIATELGVMH